MKGKGPLKSERFVYDPITDALRTGLTKKVPFSFHSKGKNRQKMTRNNRMTGIKKGLAF